VSWWCNVFLPPEWREVPVGSPLLKAPRRYARRPSENSPGESILSQSSDSEYGISKIFKKEADTEFNVLARRRVHVSL
jgi:hypothetical protein